MTLASLATRVSCNHHKHSTKYRGSNGISVLAWYHQHSLPVTPINPRADKISLPSTEYQAVASPSLLPEPENTSLSLVTPPAVSLEILKEAHAAGIKAVWLQPGTYDDAVLDYARTNFEAAIGGQGGGGSEGWCVLVDGERGLESAGRAWTAQKL